MFPDADVPVLQMSMPTLDPRSLFAIGQKLAPLRDQGTLIVGSGFTTHNLRGFNPSLGADHEAPAWSTEFDAWAKEAMEHRDVDALLSFLDEAPAAHIAHPRTEHFAPLFVALGAAHASTGIQSWSVIDGFWYGLSKRSWQLN
jgi:4,5-DOPA dioxygenase extradiol